MQTAATAFVAPIVIATPTPIDTLRLAIDQLEVANYDPNGIVLHPNDWAKVELTKESTGGYIKSDPALANVRTLWGRGVVVTTAQTAGTFLVGDFQRAATLYDRQDPTLDIATQDQDDFLRNLLKLRMELRLSLTVELPGALVTGEFA